MAMRLFRHKRTTLAIYQHRGDAIWYVTYIGGNLYSAAESILSEAFSCEKSLGSAGRTFDVDVQWPVKEPSL